MAFIKIMEAQKVYRVKGTKDSSVQLEIRREDKVEDEVVARDEMIGSVKGQLLKVCFFIFSLFLKVHVEKFVMENFRH